MRIVASYQEPRWHFYRKLVGINTYANRSAPDGFQLKHIYCNNIEELKSKIDGLLFYTVHGDPGRPMKMSDLNIRIED